MAAMEQQKWPDPGTYEPPPMQDPKEALLRKLERAREKAKVYRGGDRFYASKALWRRSNPITILRLEKGMSAKELAEEVGVSPNHLYKMNGGKEKLSPKLASKIAKVLGTSSGPLFLAYLEWLAMEPTLHRKEIRRMSMDAMKKCNPIWQDLKDRRLTLDWLSAVSGLGTNTCYRLCSDPDMAPTTRTIRRAASHLGMSHLDLYAKWTRWSDHFRRLDVEDRIVAALEYEGMEEHD